MQVDLNQMISALSDTLDLVGIDDVQHGKRVGYMAWECGAALGLGEENLKRLFQIGLVHDCGVSSSRVHKHLIDEMDWVEAQTHCDVGAERLRSCPLTKEMATPVQYHHAHWKAMRGLDVPWETRRIANLVFLVDRVDALAAPHLNGDLLRAKNDIRERIRQYGGTYFDPELVDVFMGVSDSEAFWLTLEPLHLVRFLDEREKATDLVHLSSELLRQLVDLFARVVDAKSPYTFRHSAGVGLLARHLAEDMGLSEDISARIQIAGLLHDLGKLKVPDDILEKKGSLNAADLAHLHHHSFESYVILKRITGMEDIAVWAGNHHEALNGQGYPFHRTSADLCLPSRLIAVADVFQALSQNRPYRRALPLDKIVDFLSEFAGRGILDKEVVSRVTNHPQACFEAATKFAATPEWEKINDSDSRSISESH